MLLGAGELGKEVAIECQRLGIEVIAVDRYDNAPAMHIAHRRYVINMLDGAELEAVIRKEQPDHIVPEIEAIATDTLYRLEQEGFHVVPCANAVKLTMNREGIRRLAAEELRLMTSEYRFADDEASFIRAAGEIGFPCIIKPVMSSSGKGQSIIRDESTLHDAWLASQEAGRAGKGRVIVERMIDFDYEITLLTVRAADGVHFCAPVGHRQERGDYRESCSRRPCRMLFWHGHNRWRRLSLTGWAAMVCSVLSCLSVVRILFLMKFLRVLTIPGWSH